jgi:hypothetical protein
MLGFILFAVFLRLLKLMDTLTILEKIYWDLLSNPYLTTTKDHFLLAFKAVT